MGIEKVCLGHRCSLGLADAVMKPMRCWARRFSRDYVGSQVCWRADVSWMYIAVFMVLMVRVVNLQQTNCLVLHLDNC